MRTNRGYSLIELIVVITIVVILVTGSAAALRLMSYADAERVTKKVDSALDKLQLEAMSQGKQNHYLALEWDALEKVYYMSTATSSSVLTEANWMTSTKTVNNRKKLASEDITISYSNQNNGTGFVSIRDFNLVLLISFIPSTGAFQSSAKQIIIESNNRTSTLQMVSITGNHYIN